MTTTYRHEHIFPPCLFCFVCLFIDSTLEIVIAHLARDVLCARQKELKTKERTYLGLLSVESIELNDCVTFTSSHRCGFAAFCFVDYLINKRSAELRALRWVCVRACVRACG